MNIAICVKWVPDTKIRIELDQNMQAPDRYDLVYEMNPNDRVALLEGLQVRNRTSMSVTLITVGPLHASSMLRQGLAMGADQAILIESPEYPHDLGDTVRSLGEALKSIDATLVLCGDESNDEMCGEVSSRLAMALEYNLVTSVMEISDVDFVSHRARIKKFLGRGWVQVLECRIPAVLTFIPWKTSFGNQKISEKLLENDMTWVLQSLEKKITVLKPKRSNNEPMDSQPSLYLPSTLKLARKRMGPVPQPDLNLSAIERMEALFTWGHQKRVGGMTLKGSPEQIAQQLTDILSKKGYV